MATDDKVLTSVPPPNGFSLQINQALNLLSSKFGDEINEAYKTAPATKKRAKETEAEILDKKRVVEDNQKAIMVDMRILEKSKTIGQSSKDVVDKFLGFEQLGESDYLDYLDDDDDDDSDYDSSDAEEDEESDDDDDDDLEVDNITVAMSMKDESMRLAGSTQVSGGNSDDEDDDSDDDDSDYNDSDFDDSDSEFDEDDDSSIGSYGDLMADLEQSMGVDIPAGLKVQGALHGSTMSLCSLSSSVQANDERDA